MQWFEIAGIVLCIESENSYLMDKLSSFRIDCKERADIKIRFIESENIAIPSGEMLLDEKVKWVKKSSDDYGYYIYTVIEEENRISVMVDVDTKWENATITCNNSRNNMDIDSFKKEIDTFSFFMVGVLFRNSILNNNGFVIHASSIKYNNKSIVFTARSGTGKSTHVKLWEKYVGSQVTVLNDDTPAIRFIQGVPYVFGAPWSGSSDKFINDSAPLQAIFIIEQSLENSIRQLNAKEYVSRLIPRIFLPFYNDKMMEIALQELENMISTIPIYLLKCRPDKEAFELVHECVK